MTPKDVPTLVDSSEEIAELIDVLHSTERKLEVLTGGEVDAVADRGGRAFLLRRAQDRLRQSEATKQDAILNALPAHVAMLDAQGVIVSVNEAWRTFAMDNVMQGPEYGVGLNYLDICARAHGESAADAHRAAEGISSVLAGDENSYSLEYPCHSPSERRWFLLTVTPLAGDGTPNGVVVMHLNITVRKLAEEALRSSEAEFRTLAESMPQIVWITRGNGRYVYFNQQWTEYTGLSLEESLGEGWSMPLHPDERLRATDAWQHAIATHSLYSIEIRLRRADGVYRWWLIRGVPLQDAKGNILKWFGTCTDIHDLKEAELELSWANRTLRESETRIKYMNRVYAVLSGINTLIVRASDRTELFNEACRIAVEQGGFEMSLISLVNRGDMSIVPTASAGMSDDLLDATKSVLANRATASKTMMAEAIVGKQVAVSNDLQSDRKTIMLGTQLADAGVRSLAVLPLIVAGEAVGGLALYAGEVEFFHAEEMRLLTELAGDIAYAIDHIEKQEQLTFLAYYDTLTGLANRRLFLERITERMSVAAGAGNQVAVYLLDIERFKYINDTLGQPAGDSLLQQVAELLKGSAGDPSLVARVGADQFAVMLPEVGQTQDVAGMLEKTMEEFSGHSFRLNEGIFRVACKAGVAFFPQDGSTADTLFRNAEAALKRAKAEGSRYLLYTQQMTAILAGRLTLENHLRLALEKEEFVLHYQPKVNLVTGELTSAEALIRWNDPVTGLVPPGRFIPILEETGLIFEVGRWALRKAIEDYLRWQAAGLPAVRVAVNVSPLQLRNPSFIADVRNVIGTNAEVAAGLELEITESVIMADIQHSITTLRVLRAMGIKIAIDDFGTGFSSLSYLAKLPVDTLKIDRSFVVDMTATQEGLALVSTIIGLAHSLKLNVVAEGVETEEQARLLRLLRCDEMQGYLFSKPLPCDVFETRFLPRLPAGGADLQSGR